jgi:hypothetical protein
MSKSNYTKSKSTKRFQFSVSRDETSHQAGANVVTIQSKDYDTSEGKYSTGTVIPTTVTMTVNEAQALNRFLTKTIS